LPLARAFALYSDHAKQKKRHRTVCGRILRHWTHRSAAKVFDAWQQVLLNYYSLIIMNLFV
jgi:hypothetical protein